MAQEDTEEKSLRWSGEEPLSRCPTLHLRFSEDIETRALKGASNTKPCQNISASLDSNQDTRLANPEKPRLPTTPDNPSKWMKVLQVIASFFPYMNSLGLMNSFGVFQTYYSQHIIPSKSESSIAWIGSVQAFLIMFIPMLVGPLIDVGYLRHVLVFGNLLSGFGMIIVGWCTQYYQLILAQGLMVGVGAGCVFLPSISIVPQWFSAKSRNLALGIVATGSSVGAIIFPVMFQYIQAASGFGWGVRAIGVFILGTNLFSIATLQYRMIPREKRDLVDLSMFREKPYIALCLGFCIGFMGLYVPLFFIQSYAAAEGTVPTQIVVWIVPILTGASGVGRVVLSVVASDVGDLNVATLVMATCALLSLCWIAVHSTGAIITFAVLYGFTSGGFVSLYPTVIVSTAPHMNKLATRIGMALACSSLGILVGNPVAGAILTASHRYTGMQVFAGIVMFASTSFLVVQRFLKIGAVLKVKI